VRLIQNAAFLASDSYQTCEMIWLHTSSCQYIYFRCLNESATSDDLASECIRCPSVVNSFVKRIYSLTFSKATDLLLLASMCCTVFLLCDPPYMLGLHPKLSVTGFKSKILTLHFYIHTEPT